MSLPFMKGWLLQKKDIGESWKKRYFVMKDDSLLCFDNPRDDKPRKQISLRNARVNVEQKSKSKGRGAFLGGSKEQKFIFILATPKRTYTLRASFEDELNEWVDALSSGIEFATQSSGKAGNKLVSRPNYATSSQNSDGPHFLDRYNIQNYLTNPLLVPASHDYYSQQSWIHNVHTDPALSMWRQDQALMANTNSFGTLHTYTKRLPTWKVQQPRLNHASAHDRYDSVILAGGMTSNWVELLSYDHLPTLSETDVDFEYYQNKTSLNGDGDDSEDELTASSPSNAATRQSRARELFSGGNSNLQSSQSRGTVLHQLPNVKGGLRLPVGRTPPLFSTTFHGFRSVDLFNTSSWTSQRYNDLFYRYPVNQTTISSKNTIKIPKVSALDESIRKGVEENRPEYFKKSPAATSMGVGVTWVGELFAVGTSDELIHIYKSPPINADKPAPMTNHKVANDDTKAGLQGPNRMSISAPPNQKGQQVTSPINQPNSQFLSNTNNNNNNNNIEEHIYKGGMVSSHVFGDPKYQLTLLHPYAQNANNFPLASDWSDYGLSGLSLCPKQQNLLCSISHCNIALWDLAVERPLVLSEVASSSPISAHAWSNSSNAKLAIANSRGSIKVIDTRTLRSRESTTNPILFHHHHGHTAAITTIANNPLFSTLWASAGLDGMICVWDERYDGAPLVSFPAAANGVITSLTWSNSHVDWLHTGSSNGTVTAYNLRTQPYHIAHSVSVSRDPILSLSPSRSLPMSNLVVDQAATTGFLHYKPSFVDRFVWGSVPPELFDAYPEGFLSSDDPNHPSNQKKSLLHVNAQGVLVNSRGQNLSEEDEDAWLQPYLAKNQQSIDEVGSAQKKQKPLFESEGQLTNVDNKKDPSLDGSTISKHAERFITRLMYIRDWSGAYNALCSVLDILWQKRLFWYATELLKRLSTRHSIDQVGKWGFWKPSFLIDQVGSQTDTLKQFQQFLQQAQATKDDLSKSTDDFQRSFSSLTEVSSYPTLNQRNPYPTLNTPGEPGSANQLNIYSPRNIDKKNSFDPNTSNSPTHSSLTLANSGPQSFYDPTTHDIVLSLEHDTLLYGPKTVTVKFMALLQHLSVCSPPLSAVCLTQPIPVHDRRIEFLKLRLMLHFFYQRNQWLNIYTLRKSLCNHLDFSGELLTRQEAYNQFLQQQQQNLLIQQAKGVGVELDNKLLNPQKFSSYEKELLRDSPGPGQLPVMPEEPQNDETFNPLKAMAHGTKGLFAAGGSLVWQGLKSGGSLLGLTHKTKIALNDNDRDLTLKSDRLQLLYSLRPVLDASMLSKAVLAVVVYDHTCALRMAVMVGETLKQTSQFSLFSSLAMALLNPTIYYTNTPMFNYGIDSTAIYFKNKIIAHEYRNQCPTCGLRYGLLGPYFATQPETSSSTDRNSQRKQSRLLQIDAATKQHSHNSRSSKVPDSSRLHYQNKEHLRLKQLLTLDDSESTDPAAPLSQPSSSTPILSPNVPSDGDSQSDMTPRNKIAPIGAQTGPIITKNTPIPFLPTPHSLFPFSLDSDHDEDDELPEINDLEYSNISQSQSLAPNIVSGLENVLRKQNKQPARPGQSRLNNPFEETSVHLTEDPFFNPAAEMNLELTSLVNKMKSKQEKSRLTQHHPTGTGAGKEESIFSTKTGPGPAPDVQTTSGGKLTTADSMASNLVAPELKLKAQSSTERDLRNPKIVIEQLQFLLEIFDVVRSSETSVISSLTGSGGSDDRKNQLRQQGSLDSLLSKQPTMSALYPDVNDRANQPSKYRDSIRDGQDSYAHRFSVILNNSARFNEKNKYPIGPTPSSASPYPRDSNSTAMNSLFAGSGSQLPLELFGADEDMLFLQFLPDWQKMPLWNPYRRLFYSFDCSTCCCAQLEEEERQRRFQMQALEAGVTTTSTTVHSKKIITKTGSDGRKRQVTIDLDKKPSASTEQSSSAASASRRLSTKDQSSSAAPVTTSLTLPQLDEDSLTDLRLDETPFLEFDGSIYGLLTRGCTPLVNIAIEHPRNMLKAPRMPQTLGSKQAQELLTKIERKHPVDRDTQIITGLPFLLYLHALSTLDRHDVSIYVASRLVSLYHGLPFAKAVEHRLNSDLVSSAVEWLNDTCTRNKYSRADVGSLHNGACGLTSILMRSPTVPALLEQNVPQLYRRLQGEIQEVLTYIATDPSYTPDAYQTNDDDGRERRRNREELPQSLRKAKYAEAVNKANALSSAITQIVKAADDKWDASNPGKQRPAVQYAPYYRPLLTMLTEFSAKYGNA